MGLIDRGHDKYLEEARTYWRENGIDADITHIAAKMHEETHHTIEREKRNIIATWFCSLYDYDHISLQTDITKCIIFEQKDNFPAKEKRKLLRVLWSSVQVLFPNMDYTSLLNEIERMAEFNRSVVEEDFPPVN